MLRIFILLGVIVSQLVLGGCSAFEENYEKLRDLDFTVVEAGNEPETLVEIIDEKKEEPFQLSYTIGEDMYLVIGYGMQETCGYSIQVNECYETEGTVYVDTTLLGPETEEEIVKKPSYPYIIIKIEVIADKLIEFH